MKSYKKIMPVFLTAALLGSAAFSVHAKMENASTYHSAVSQARSFAEKGILEDAMAQYETAASVNPSLPLYLEAGEVYLANEDYSGAQDWYKNTLKPRYPKEAATYLYGIRCYAAEENIREVFSIYHEYQGRELFLQEVEDAIDPYRYAYTTSGNYQDAKPYSNTAGLAAVKYDGHWGYIDTDGDRKVQYIYDDAGLYGDFAPVVDQDGNALYIDPDGNARINKSFILEKDPDFKNVVKFQNIQSNYILAFNGEYWNYYDAQTYEKQFGGYADARPIVNGVGAVSKDGQTWALIDETGTELTDYIYEQVLADEKNIICRNNALIVKTGDGFQLAHSDGMPIGSETYSDAKAFNNTGYAAVQKNGKWIFVNQTGTEYDLGSFEDAQSFSCGLAGVKQNGRWGYININGELAIDFTFADCKPFNDTGVSFVQTETGDWQLLSLYQYMSD